jgi:hypothetical protein
VAVHQDTCRRSATIPVGLRICCVRQGENSMNDGFLEKDGTAQDHCAREGSIVSREGTWTIAARGPLHGQRRVFKHDRTCTPSPASRLPGVSKQRYDRVRMSLSELWEGKAPRLTDRTVCDIKHVADNDTCAALVVVYE